MTLDYAAVYEAEFRPRHRRRALALAVWTGLLILRPRTALAIWRARG
jgi:hypothetical protein